VDEKSTLLKKIFMSTVILSCLDSGIVASKYIMDSGGEGSPSARVLVETYLASCVIYLPVILVIVGVCVLVFRKSGKQRTAALFLMLTLAACAVILMQYRKFVRNALGSSLPMVFLAVVCAGILILVLRQKRTKLAAESILAIHMAFAAFLLIPSSRGHQESPKTESPNVVFILIDAMRYDRLGCYGNEAGLTPCIDRIAGEALVYENVYVHWPTSGPSHSAMLTGKPVYDHRALNGKKLGVEYVTLAEVLRQNGYRTAGFVQNKLLSCANHYDQGFDVFIVDEIADLKNATSRVLIDHLLPVQLYYRFAGRDRFTGEAIRWMEKNRDRNMFLFMQYFHPHIPYTPPKRYIRQKDYDGVITGSLEQSRAIRNGEMQVSREDIDYMVELYNAEVRYADEQVGKLYDFLKDHGMLENTMLIVTSDHGENLYEHKKFFAHGNELYESTVHIPLIIKYPEGKEVRGRSDVLLRDIDFMPHILHTCGIDTSGSRMGNSFYVNAGIGILGITCNSEQTLLYTKRENWKYILNFKTMEEELFDLDRDPHETENLREALPRICLSLQNTILKEVRENKAISDFISNGCGNDEHDKDTDKMLRSLGYID
jgi:phosphoglycerol transferase MdoB-like AlkP superfamily enzyme